MILTLSESQDKDNEKSKELKIDDFEMDTESPAHVRTESAKILARWLIRHWMMKKSKRKALTFSGPGVSYRPSVNSRLKGARKS